jgi:tetratricopeptide (TPR) repeat protein
MHWNLNPNETEEAIARFHALLDEALELDPNFATAYAMKAVEYSFSMIRALPRSEARTPSDWRNLAIEHADRALAIDSRNGLAHMARALALYASWDGRGALEEYDKALALSPNNVDILDDYSRLNIALGRVNEAIDQARRIIELSPAQGEHVAWMFWTAGRFDEAVSLLRGTLSSPTIMPVGMRPFMLGLSEALRGNGEQSYEFLRQAESAGLSDAGPRWKAQYFAYSAYAFGRIGRPLDARRMFDQLRELATEYEVFAGTQVLADLGVGDHAASSQGPHSRSALPKGPFRPMRHSR